MSLTEIFILSVIIGPLIETFLFQYLIIEILYFFKKIKINTIIIISSITFSLIHYYNLIYILVTFLSGIIYASYYLYLKVEKQKSPFLYIWFLHSLYNFSVFILDDILSW
ncbi:MAG: CPBP family glutamic-type intramembrane protease [Kordia sp.]|uniref:CPBP family glutamic-type intramembrane protease n=1 Tax=Kordia sp. TaxID=1965332 RepID=UPI00385F9AE9